MDHIDGATQRPASVVNGVPDDGESSVDRHLGTGQIRSIYGFNPSLAGISTPVTGIGESSRIPILDTNGLGWPGEH